MTDADNRRHQSGYAQQTQDRRQAESAPVLLGFQLWTTLVYDETMDDNQDFRERQRDQDAYGHPDGRGSFVIRLVCQIPGEPCPRVLQDWDGTHAVKHAMDLSQMARMRGAG